YTLCEAVHKVFGNHPRALFQADHRAATDTSHKRSLRQHFSWKALHAARNRYADDGWCCVVKMVSSGDCLDPSGNDVDDGGNKHSGHDDDGRSLVHGIPLPQLSKLGPIARTRCDRRHKVSLFGPLAHRKWCASSSITDLEGGDCVVPRRL